jgi:hypothetical protein
MSRMKVALTQETEAVKIMNSEGVSSSALAARNRLPPDESQVQVG